MFGTKNWRKRILTYNYNEEEIDTKESFYVSFIYPNQYKEVVMIRAVDLQIVVGNAGGYIGLFCGKKIYIISRFIIVFWNIN